MKVVPNESPKARIICLVSPGNLSTNPRLVKEADALVEAGFSVHVISTDYIQAAKTRDASIQKRAKWQSTLITSSPHRFVYLLRRLIQASCRCLFSLGCRNLEISARAHHPLFPALRSAALATRADFYIGHCLAALPVVVTVGKKKRAKIGFDAEDFHSHEVEEFGRGRLDNAIARSLEAKLLSQCHHLTAASPLIAKAYEDAHGVKPKTLLNVFPLSEAVAPQPAPDIPSFYWFSQTIGPGRGLESFIKILQRLQRKVILDLRGQATRVYRAQLNERIQDSLIELRFLPPDDPQFMVRDSTGYTAGLALELRQPLNRDLCLTNKAFTYLLAGLPVIFSRTQAQEQLATELGEAALLVDLEKPNHSAVKIDEWLADSSRQVVARDKAFKLGRERYNWDWEQQRFLKQVEMTLGDK